ncbi:metallophosphoesterase [Thermoflavimicrobium daqui]|uniref:Serine/threonine protein phosphatase n=1 Tax=Thermoflavimicrobium daqui TaxID=2137476 RepID=A0A364K0Z0_9BACL|nr:metallophosphoesterase [Thermoflavimicrobium daqui]RAL21351.1 serine/threonine protein phosphatase [Thermoflavimicrobium daqui]
MKRILAISDIHGALDQLENLLEKVKYDSTKDQLILLGDYIDRGPNAKGVVEKVIQLKSKGAIALKGNHEDWMIKAFQGQKDVILKWIKNGGRQTLHSYGFTIDPENIEESFANIQSDLIQEHIAFLDSLPLYYELDPYIFVHAGVHPTLPFADTEHRTFLWIRDEFHQNYQGEKIVVFGHTPTTRLHGCADVYFGKNHIIGIDGGCVFGGQLNCLELPSQQVTYVDGEKLEDDES